MKIFMAGDWRTGTGPANVTKYYIENLPKGTLYQKTVSKPTRLFEIIFKTLCADTVVYSGYSKQNIIGLKLAKKWGKKSAYIMHGCVEHENRINKVPDEEMARIERQTMQLCDMIIAVSPSFEGWLKQVYPEHAAKITHVTNAVDEHILKLAEKSEKDGGENIQHDKKMILSIGGGMPRKQIVKICEAVKRINDIQGRNLKLVVIGDVGADTEAINAFSFVDNRGLVTFTETIELMKKAGLFVQNSCFETFGLAPIEAIACGCPTLMSREVGALCLMSNAGFDDIINHYDDPTEIADKIDYLLEHPNAERLLEGIDIEKNTWSYRCEELISKLSQIQ